MSCCITREQFQHLLADELSEAAWALIADHLEVCTQCQENWDRWLNDSSDDSASDLPEVDWRLLRGGNPTPSDQPSKEFLQRLRDNPLPPRSAGPGSRARNGSVEIHFPEPPTARGPLGRLGSYHIMAKLGQGGFGQVFEAYDEKLNCLVALKVMRPDLAADQREEARFEDEARKAAAVRHDNIVTVHCVGNTPGFQPYFVMEYIEGGTLKTRLQNRQGVLEREKAVEIIRQAALGLAAAHARGLVHRDIKPSNILLEQGTGRAKIADFGLAKRLDVDQSQSRSGAMAGTPPYMAPEQAQGQTQDISPATDVYALGATLYETLTGRPPFLAETLLDTLQQVAHKEPVPPRRLQPDLPRDLETICLKCLHKQPTRRYATAAELAEDLQRYQDGKPIMARRVGALERGMKWAWRRPAAATLVGLTVLGMLSATVGGFLYAGWERDRANQESALRQKAERAEEQAQAEKENANRSAAEAKAVLDFFQDHVLAATRPEGQEGGLGIHATIHDAVHRAEPKIAEYFHDRPVVEASVRTTLGLTYWYLREDAAAIQQLERALELRQEHLGPNHFDTLSSMNNLANAYQEAGQFDKALPLYEQTLAKRQEQLGPDHPATLESMNDLALAYEDADQRDKALPLMEQTLAKQTEKLGPDHPDTLTSMNNLAFAYERAGQRAKALPLYEQTLARRTKRLGPDHPRTLESMNNLANAYHAVGQLDKALPLYEQARTKFTEKLGPNHPLTLIAMNNLATAYRDFGQLDKALPLFEQTLARQQEKLGPDHPNTLHSMNNLISVYLKNRCFNQAERTLRDCLTLCQQKQPDAWITFHLQSRLGASLFRRKHYAAAEPLLLAGYEGLKQREATIPAKAKNSLTEALERLVQLYDAWGKPEKAAAWRQKLEQAQRTR